jgi:hypothetical protein
MTGKVCSESASCANTSQSVFSEQFCASEVASSVQAWTVLMSGPTDLRFLRSIQRCDEMWPDKPSFADRAALYASRMFA